MAAVQRPTCLGWRDLFLCVTSRAQPVPLGPSLQQGHWLMRNKEHCNVYQARTPDEILVFRDVAEENSTAVLFPCHQARFRVAICCPGVPSLAPQGGGLWAAEALHKDGLPFLHQVFSVLWMPRCFNNPTADFPLTFHKYTRLMLLRSF